ncbi:PSD1 and planctomycete cytochrome C domain-containing protein [Verrucomicrobiota bacterium sgz303538]
MHSRTMLALASFLLLGATVWAVEDPVTQFDREVRPILEERCFECHGPEKQKGGLRLDQKSGLFGGGDSGEPAVLPGKSADSPLMKFILSTDPNEKMPPKGERLKPEQVLALRQWIDHGAHLPTVNQESQEAAPVAKGMQVTDRDREFWSFQPPQRHQPKLEGAPEWPQQPLDRFILARLQQKNLEPSVEAPRSVLLRRVTFDLTGLPPTPEEVDEFVADTSPGGYERLVERLLASPHFGERMASLWLPLARYAEDQAHQVGDDTKFFYPNAHLYRAWVIGAFNRDLPYDRFLQLQLAADRLPSSAPGDLAALGFLGLGPKYYNRNRLEVMADEWEDRVDTVSRTMLGLTVACARCHDHKFDPIPTRDYYALAGVFASTRMVNKTADGRVEKGDTKADKMDPATLHIVEDGDVQYLHVFVRGNVERKGELAPRRFLNVLTHGEPAVFTDGSGRRELAEAIASRQNPLTARVFVNRVWALFFGRPLVSTPSNFGNSGAQPSHPELLDDLAVRFMDGGWSVKSLVREIVLSATYRQSSLASGSKAAIDPANELLWRMNRRRLSVEQWRDAVLSTAGELEETIGAKSQDLDAPNNHLRTVYARISRLKLNDVLMQWDYPDANVHAEKRSVTITPIQKLFVLNSAFMQRYATALADRVLGTAESDEDRLRLIYRLLYAREPNSSECSLALDFLQRPGASDMSRWEQYAQALLASNEMLYVD